MRNPPGVFSYSRIALLGVDQVRNLKIEGQVGLVVLRVTRIAYLD